MAGISERNDAGKFYVNTRIEVARTKSAADFPDFDEFSDVYKLLTDLIEVNAKGFRGVVVTALVGLHLNSDYDPLDNFYGCNPRAIFEKGIWDALQESGIPCGKSDPLNVAKNTYQLNEDWAKGRRPQRAAMAVVDFLQMVMEASQSRRARLIDYFFYRLWKYAQAVNAYELVRIDSVQQAKLDLGSQLIHFTLEYPESGQLPQYLVSQLLQALFKHSHINVMGGDESVFGTNTTSKKPADIWLEEQNRPTNLYEVTVKEVSRKRLDDSIDALEQTGHLDCPVIFICRIPEDVAELSLSNSHVVYRGKSFEFIDYRSFCLTLFALLAEQDLAGVVENVSQLIRNKDMSTRTKAGWNVLFGVST
ncbi:MAG: hypothetical protein WA902_22395 [Thermosynechococcaceae cyanobacterium]